MRVLDFDPASLRDWLAAVGLLRLISETTDTGRLVWQLEVGRYRLVVKDVPDDLAQRCAAWVAANRNAWHFAGRQNVDFDGEYWRAQALAAAGVEVALWCALASDAVWHRDGKKLKSSGLEYAHGGGHQHWLASLRDFLAESTVTAEQFARFLANHRDETMDGRICRWDAACERDHALRAKAPSKDPIVPGPNHQRARRDRARELFVGAGRARARHANCRFVGPPRMADLDRAASPCRSRSHALLRLALADDASAALALGQVLLLFARRVARTGSVPLLPVRFALAGTWSRSMAWLKRTPTACSFFRLEPRGSQK
jgi:hypothetical protein